MAAESLVDGLDLDYNWCQENLADLPDVLTFALTLVEGKRTRVFDPSLGQVTCFIANKEEARRLHEIPGVQESSTS